MSSDWARGMFDRLTINPRRTTAAAARKKSMQEAIPGLPDHLVVADILKSDYFADPADLARLIAAHRGEPRYARCGGGEGASVCGAR